MNRITISITEQLDGRTVAQVLRSVFSMSERRISRLKRVPYGILLNGREVYTGERVPSDAPVVLVIGNSELGSEEDEFELFGDSLSGETGVEDGYEEEI